MIWVLMCSPKAGVLCLFGAYRNKATAFDAAGVDPANRPVTHRSGNIETWRDVEHDMHWRLEGVDLE